MESIKGFARRTTQSFRERLGRAEPTPANDRITEVAAKVRVMEAKSMSIRQKVIRAARLMEELGATLKDIGEEYRQVPDLATESIQLAEEVLHVGVKLLESSQEHQKGLKDNAFDVLNQFGSNCDRMKELEDAQRSDQLEYDFFRAKVTDLRKNPPRDFSRIPRNEQILESKRIELHRVTENYKALCSSLYVEGRRAMDTSVQTTVQVLNSFVQIASSGFKQMFTTSRLPEYPTEPILPPCALPPNPLPPLQFTIAYPGTMYTPQVPGQVTPPTAAEAQVQPAYVQPQMWSSGAPQAYQPPQAQNAVVQNAEAAGVYYPPPI